MLFSMTFQAGKMVLLNSMTFHVQGTSWQARAEALTAAHSAQWIMCDSLCVVSTSTHLATQHNARQSCQI